VVAAITDAERARRGAATHARENIYLGYCRRWVRPIDALPTPTDLMAKADPVQRQLLGDISSPLT